MFGLRKTAEEAFLDSSLRLFEKASPQNLTYKQDSRSPADSITHGQGHRNEEAQSTLVLTHKGQKLVLFTTVDEWFMDNGVRRDYKSSIILIPAGTSAGADHPIPAGSLAERATALRLRFERDGVGAEKATSSEQIE